MTPLSPRFLIVEDHPFQRDLLKQTLFQFGAKTVHGAENGAEALRVLRDPSTPVDIVISDLMMPEVDGIELIPSLRQYAGISLILASADSVSLTAAVLISKGHGVRLLGSIAKPVTAEKLAPLLELYEAQQATRRSS